MKEKRTCLGVFLSVALFVGAAHSEADSASSADAEPAANATAQPSTDELGGRQFTPPRFINAGQFNYPSEPEGKQREGWVQLNMMIDREGKPFEIGIVDSTGDPVFEKAALANVKNHRFEPATLDGKPVDAAFSFKAIFSIEHKAKSAPPEFVRKYKLLIKAVRADDRATAEKILKDMKIESLYEDAFFNLARFFYFNRWGNDEQQMQALRRAIAYESRSKFLPPADYEVALAELFNRQLKAKDFAAALRTYRDFSPENRNSPDMEKLVKNIMALRQDETAYSVHGEIDANSTWFFELFKRNFSILLSQGELAEIKLRCQRRFVLIKYKPNMDYSVPENYGYCYMEMVGTPGAKFTLIQS